ncbi:hypothetical protein GCM10010449_03330 [Streptomyces rectiviolaceus]|uniref:Uncharacterized protein n=1 Tax=Streptomyces rectiviolaceus TaxID=332591 RepID=A0ABP6M6J3_9ACTN
MPYALRRLTIRFRCSTYAGAVPLARVWSRPRIRRLPPVRRVVQPVLGGLGLPGVPGGDAKSRFGPGVRLRPRTRAIGRRAERAPDRWGLVAADLSPAVGSAVLVGPCPARKRLVT